MPEQEILLELPAQPEPEVVKPSPSMPLPPKLIPIDRSQTFWATVDVEELIGEDHRARAIWDLTGRLNLSKFQVGMISAKGQAGRPSWDPRLLLSIWLYAYSEGITSAREIERMMEYEPAFRWLAGLQVINHHTLSDFRVEQEQELNELFVQLLVALQKAKLVKLERVMHDGTKVRAQAGTDSFRREKTVREQLEQARQLVQEDPGAEGSSNQRREKARERAQREREERLSKAVTEFDKLQKGKSEEEKEQVRVSVSEPEARRMKHGDNAIAPSYNVQVSTDAEAGVIVGVHLSQQSSDAHNLDGAMDEVKKNLGEDPKQSVVDGGFINQETITQMDKRKIDLIGSLADRQERSEAAMKSVGIDPKFAPHFFIFQPASNTMECPAGKPMGYVGQSRKRGNHYRQYRAEGSNCSQCEYQKQCCPRAPWKGRTVSRLESESEVVAKFREKMTSEEAQAIYKQRGAVAEFPFAWIKEKFGLRKFRSRGLAKATLEAVWACLTHNVMIWIRKCWKKGPSPEAEVPAAA